MEKNMIKNVVIYTRVSTEEQVLGFSLQNQLDTLIKVAETSKYNVVNTYTDAGISGTSTDGRLQYQEMIQFIEDNPSKIQAILIWKLSRISRNLNDFTSLISYLDKKGIALISTEDGINTGTSIGKFTAHIIGAVSEMERENIVSNARSGMKKRAELGLWGGGVVLGYDSVDKKLVINVEEAEIVKTIFHLYVHKDYGYNRITKHLNARGMKTKRGNTWAHSTVKSVLDNPLYAGYIRYGVRKNWNKERKNNNNPNYTLVKSNNHLPIITEDLWQMTKNKRAKVGIANPKVWKGDWLLSGLPKCPVCGASMVAHRVKRKSKKHPDGKMYRYYICSQYSNKDTSVCKPNLIDAELTENYTIEKLLEFVSNPDLVNAIAEQAKGKNKPDTSKIEADILKLEKKLKDLKTEENLFYGYLGNPDKLKRLKEEYIIAKIEETSKNIEYVNEEIDKAHYQIKSLEREEQTIESITLALKHFKALFNEAGTEEKKKLLHSLIKEIKIKQSDDFKARTVEKIILAFNEADVTKYLNSSAKKENLKAFVPTYDTVHSS